jgi:hypothetical protein
MQDVFFTCDYNYVVFDDDAINTTLQLRRLRATYLCLATKLCIFGRDVYEVGTLAKCF